MTICPSRSFVGVRTLSSGRFNPGHCDCGSSHGHAGAFGVALEDLVPFIDWSPFFHTWELRGVYPKILQHEKHGEEARKLFADAQTAAGGNCQPRNRCNSAPSMDCSRRIRVGDDVEVYTDGSRTTSADDVPFPAPADREGRRHAELVSGGFHRAESELAARLTIGAFAVTSGHGLKEIVEKFKADHDDYNAIMAEALADRLAEAFAEYLHQRVRDEWGFGKIGETDDRRPDRGKVSRHPSGGGLSRLPRPHGKGGCSGSCSTSEKHTGIKLTESFAMWPGSSVSGLYFAHPDSKYFAVGKLGNDQVARLPDPRKGMTLAGSGALARARG